MKLEAQFQRYNFFRDPAWRWRRVLKILSRSITTPSRCSKHDDKYIIQARKFHQEWSNSDVEDRDEMWRDNPDLFYAYQFNERMLNEPEGAMHIQARLLAGQSFDEIAEAMTSTTGAIRWYEALYFNVLPYLNARDWVTSRILMPSFLRYQNLSGDDDGNQVPFKDSVVAKPFMDASLKLFAYFGGPVLVDFLMHGLQSGKHLTSMDDLPNWLDNTWATIIRRRSCQAAFEFEINKYNVLELFSIHTRIMEIEKSDESQSQKRSEAERHIKALIDEIPFAVGRAGEALHKGTKLASHDREAAELRDEEVHRVSAGEEFDIGEWPKELPPPRPQGSKVITGNDTLLL